MKEKEIRREVENMKMLPLKLYIHNLKSLNIQRLLMYKEKKKGRKIEIVTEEEFKM